MTRTVRLLLAVVLVALLPACTKMPPGAAGGRCFLADGVTTCIWVTR